MTKEEFKNAGVPQVVINKMEEIKIIFTDKTSLEFTGEYLGETNPQNIKTENWKFYREIKGKIHHLKKETIFRVESDPVNSDYFRFDNVYYKINTESDKPYKVLSDSIIDTSDKNWGKHMVLYTSGNDLFITSKEEFDAKFRDIFEKETI